MGKGETGLPCRAILVAPAAVTGQEAELTVQGQFIDAGGGVAGHVETAISIGQVAIAATRPKAAARRRAKHRNLRSRSDLQNIAVAKIRRVEVSVGIDGQAVRTVESGRYSELASHPSGYTGNRVVAAIGYENITVGRHGHADRVLDAGADYA